MSAPLPRRARERLLELGRSPGDDELVDDEPGKAERGPGAVIGRFRVARELGRGGMGVVYEAFDPELSRRVALKVLTPSASMSAEVRQRFVREARAAAKLSHPNIAAVFEAGPERIVMQLVDGHTLAERPVGDPRELAALMRDAALAVHAAHQQGIVHRDLKPSNLMVERHGERLHAYVMDFGLAKATDLDGSLSVPGGILGTPHYMSPEQAGAPGEVGPRSDVYGLGATLYDALAGRPPFEGDDVYELLRRRVEGECPDLRRVAPRVDRDLATVVMKCLASDPAQRYPSALALAGDLDRWLRGEAIRARPQSMAYRARKYLTRRRNVLVAAGVAALLVAGLLAPISMRQRAERLGAERAMELGERVRGALGDSQRFLRAGDPIAWHARLDQGIEACRAFLAETEIGRGHFLLAKLYLAQQRLPEARAAVERALELSPELEAVRFERGILGAIEVREARVAGGPDVPAGLTERAAEAAADLERGLAASERSSVEERLGHGLLAWLRGDLARAEEHLRDVLRLETTHLQANFFLSHVYAARGDGSRSLRFAVRATDVLRGFGPAYEARAAPWPPSGGEGDAPLVTPPGARFFFLDFRELVELVPGEATSYGNRALFEIRQAAASSSAAEALGAWGGAVSLLDAGITSSGRPEDPAAVAVRLALLNNRAACRLEEARLLAEQGDAELARTLRLRAAEDLDDALALDDASTAALCNRGLLWSGDAEGAFLAGRFEGIDEARAAARADLERAAGRLAGSAAERVARALERLGH